MGSYSAPAFALGYYKGIIDNTVVANTVIIGPVRCASFQYAWFASALFDGTPKLQLQKTDDTWDFIDQLYSNGDLHAGMSEYSIINPPGQDYKFPFVARIICDTQPSTGVLTAWLVTQPTPANPLF